MRRGEIWLVDLDPGLGSEADKMRPAVMVSDNGANAAAQRSDRGVLTVVPVTTNVRPVWAAPRLQSAG
ncbi:MAG TPA: type II toxin-antitoxin system PemK/MazF family toxin [Pseudonocardiaceae bacterium]|jgi:mRNA interferase MazF|nr:type II toxin-antitoxin system PemK/MazF family toxin [Pseudonocardiaceae bacterium]